MALEYRAKQAKPTGFVKKTCQSQQAPFYNSRGNSTHGHHQMVNTEIRLIIFFAAKDGEALYSQQKKRERERETRS